MRVWNPSLKSLKFECKHLNKMLGRKETHAECGTGLGISEGREPWAGEPGVLPGFSSPCGVSLFFVVVAGREVDLRVIFVFNRKLSSEELERKRQEMMENAKWREEERLNILKKHAKDDEREQRLEKLDSRDGKFIQ